MVNHRLPLRRAMIPSLLALALTTGLAACGSSSKNDTTATTTQATATATVTQPGQATTTDSGQATQPQTTEQKVVPVNGSDNTLTSGGATMTVKVDQLIDPVKTVIDKAQKGNKLVGVVVSGTTTGKFEPTRTQATAVLNTTDGGTSAVRIIADGDCAGGFFPAGILNAAKKPATGCIGFEVPKSAKPDSITISLATDGKGGKQATWKLPAAN